MFQAASGSGKRAGVLMVVALFLATPLLCAAHSLHQARAATTSEATHGHSDHAGQKGQGHSGETKELCSLGAALLSFLYLVERTPVFASHATSECFVVSRAPEVPQPVPISFSLSA